MMQTPVLVVGGGPVGSTLALDLASRGIDVMVAERNPTGQMPGVKCNHRRGPVEISAPARDRSGPGYRTGRIITNDVRDPHIGCRFTRVRAHSSDRRDRYTDRSGPDGWWPTPEPPHRINQIYLDPLLAAFARAHPRIRYINQLKVEGFHQSDDGVVAEATDLATGKRQRIESDYLVGCDGPSSRIRNLIDARLTGDAMIGRAQSSYSGSD